ncbi:unnamed protein product [Amoebophrya sp. A25]|nr:unnamed protein product [Amoebophrya sp. A25]|eukprot:GSA25T00020473001.1
MHILTFLCTVVITSCNCSFSPIVSRQPQFINIL